MKIIRQISVIDFLFILAGMNQTIYGDTTFYNQSCFKSSQLSGWVYANMGVL